MITGKSGYFDLKGSVSTFTLRVNWSEEYDEITNTSLVRIDSVQVKSTKYANGYFPDGLVKINGQTVITMNSYYGTHSLSVHGLGPWYAIETAGDEVAGGSTEVVHEADGSKSVVIEVTGNRLNGCRFIGGTSGEDNGWYVSGSQTVELTAIPRASTVTASDADIGAAAKIAIIKRSAAYTHSVAFSFGTLSGYLTETGEITDTETRFSVVSVSFPLPESFYYEIPDASSGVCTLTVCTYSGDIQIGEEQTAAFTVRAVESDCGPLLTGTAVDTNAATIALTGDESILIKNASTVLCDLSVQARYGATITERFVNGQSIEGDTVTLSPFTADSVVFRVVDSRGIEAEYTCPVTILDYYIPSGSASASRTDPTSGNAVLQVRGKCFYGSFGAASNSLTVIYTVNGGEPVSNAVEIAQDGTYAAMLDLSGLDYEREHAIQVWVEDAIYTTNAKTVTVGKGIPVFDWGESDFRFHVPVNFEKGLTMPKALLADLVYPVGSIYLSVLETDPGALFGGTWERIQDRFLLAAGDNYQNGTTGGAATHTLTTEELPSHNHGFLDHWTTAYGSGSKYKSVALNGDGEGSDAVKNDRSCTADAGGGQPFNILPPYLAVCVWKRTA